MIQAVVFDLDDTLFPEQEFVSSGFWAVDDWLSKQYATPGFFPVAWAYFQAGQRGNIFDLTLAQLGIAQPGIDLTANLIQDLLTVYRQHQPRLSLYPDAQQIINFLTPRLPLGMITDGYFKTQKNKVAALGIGSAFRQIIYSDEFGRANWKPSPFPYQRMMNFFNCQGSELIYIGDNPVKDFITARQLRWTTVQICRPDGVHASLNPEPDYAADYQIQSLEQLPTLLADLKNA